MEQYYSLRQSIPADAVYAYMCRWKTKLGDAVQIQQIGSSGRFPIQAAFFTDPSVPADHKQTAIITAQHSGIEISGMNTLLSLGNRLSVGDETVRNILRRQLVILIPCPNPFSYSMQSEEYHFKNEAGIDEYTAFTTEGVPDPQKAPSAAALQKLIDQYRPELLLDCHGPDYEHSISVDSVGVSTFQYVTLYDTDFSNAMHDAAAAKGYAVYHTDMIQRLRTNPETIPPEYHSRFSLTQSRMVTANTYAYLQYHTLGGTLEVFNEESGVLKIFRALELGCGPCGLRGQNGYPVDTICAGFFFNSVDAYGSNAAQRRESRTVLWQNLQYMSYGGMHPQLPGFAGFVFSTSETKNKKYMPNGWSGSSVTSVIEAVQELPYMDVPAMRAFHGKRNGMFLDFPQIGHGDIQLSCDMELCFSLPYSQETNINILLNGHTVPADGYTVTRNKNWTFVHIPVIAGEIHDFNIVMMQYTCESKQNGILEFD